MEHTNTGSTFLVAKPYYSKMYFVKVTINTSVFCLVHLMYELRFQWSIVILLLGVIAWPLTTVDLR